MFFFFFNDTATTEIYTLSLHDALPIYLLRDASIPLDVLLKDLGDENPDKRFRPARVPGTAVFLTSESKDAPRSEEHTSELQSLAYLVCRLLLEKKNSSTAAPHRLLSSH